MSDCIYGKGCNLPSEPNDVKVLLCQLKREVEKLMKDTKTQLLIHDGKIAECCRYLKDNLPNSIRCLLNDMKYSRRIRKFNNRSTFG